METIRLECDRLISNFIVTSHDCLSLLRLKTFIQKISGFMHETTKLEETSSAYNTGGESCRSTPLKSDVSSNRLPQFSIVLREADLRKRKPIHVSASRKLKRRSDGSKYITKKPVRSRLLKEREEQLNRERSGITTDDDAISELKTGRFWSREERKKHLEKSRERKLRQHQLIAEKQRLPSDQIIVQLSHKKMMRKEGKKVFDKYTTLQEFLAHGIRGPTNRLIEGVLSVTTV
uniref:Ribosome biogenesis protein NOP53 n=1 Tax=Syphacia muris TaxID=451379 RepID=A0A0N5AWA9_9BILA